MLCRKPRSEFTAFILHVIGVLINLSCLREWEELAFHLLHFIGSSHSTPSCKISHGIIQQAINSTQLNFKECIEVEDDGTLEEAVESFELLDALQFVSPFSSTIRKRLLSGLTDVERNEDTNPFFCEPMQQYLLKFYMPFAPININTSRISAK